MCPPREYRELELASLPVRSRLNAALVKDGLASSASMFVDGEGLGSTMQVVVTAIDPTNLTNLENAINDELSEAAKGPRHRRDQRSGYGRRG